MAAQSLLGCAGNVLPGLRNVECSGLRAAKSIRCRQGLPSIKRQPGGLLMFPGELSSMSERPQLLRLQGQQRCSSLGRGCSLAVSASSADAGGLSDSEGESSSSGLDGRHKGSMQAVVALLVGVGVAVAAALAGTLATGGPAALVDAIARSGFPAACSMVFVIEVGDKTFFVAALLAMKHAKWPVMVGASTALALMTVISVLIGRLFHKIPAQLQSTLPIGEWVAIALLVWFGLQSIKTAYETEDAPPPQKKGEAVEEVGGELAAAQEIVSQSKHKELSQWAVVLESFTLVFVAEWGDRSMLATIALAVAQSPVGVATGAILAHTLATGLAVLGGALLANYISEKVVGYIGGVLFLLFAVATALHIF